MTFNNISRLPDCLVKTAPKQTKRCVPHSRRTASDILEEGGDDVKSAWPLWAGPHTCYSTACSLQHIVFVKSACPLSEEEKGFG
ncbi:hypothetical protein CTI12_AA550890 [Artemisia annua]|uniref:Uncharacterized protein n=1 Tax=Artemisia annua TaxID=35608 RepID=A0A2U1KYF2_ARTAN|nr:hypothetical protein CTI12_AA550890 [Artemisia annua]